MRTKVEGGLLVFGVTTLCLSGSFLMLSPMVEVRDELDIDLTAQGHTIKWGIKSSSR